MPKLNLYSRFWKPRALACHRGHPCSQRCKYLEYLDGESTIPRFRDASAPKPAVWSTATEPLFSTLTGRSLQATATGRNAPEPSSSRARRPTVFVGSCRSLARFGCQRSAKETSPAHIIMADGSYRTV